jgi:hypothetical protein
MEQGVEVRSKEFRLPEHVFFETLDDGQMVILETTGARYLMLNATAGYLFNRLLDCPDLPTALETAHAAFPAVSRDELASDLEELLSTLCENGVLERA